MPREVKRPPALRVAEARQIDGDQVGLFVQLLPRLWTDRDAPPVTAHHMFMPSVAETLRPAGALLSTAVRIPSGLATGPLRLGGRRC